MAPPKKDPEPKQTGTQAGSAAVEKRTDKGAGTQRWPKNALKDGEWIQLPKVTLKRLGKMDLEPRHLWLLLVLESERYQNRPPRFYWEELAEFCGKDRNTVRKWAYELKKMGLLDIKQSRQLNPNETRRPGHRNERNEFFLKKFEARVRDEQEQWERTRRQPRKRVGSDEDSDIG